MFIKNCDLTVHDKHLDDGQPRWIRLPIAEARLLNALVELPAYCETLRHQGKRRAATTFHAVVNARGQPDRLWVACSECTNLMMSWRSAVRLGRGRK